MATLFYIVLILLSRDASLSLHCLPVYRGSPEEQLVRHPQRGPANHVEAAVCESPATLTHWRHCGL